MNGSPSGVLSVGLGSWGSTRLVVTLGLGTGGVTATLVGRWTEVLTLSCNPEGTQTISVDPIGMLTLAAERIVE